MGCLTQRLAPPVALHFDSDYPSHRLLIWDDSAPRVGGSNNPSLIGEPGHDRAADVSVADAHTLAEDHRSDTTDSTSLKRSQSRQGLEHRNACTIYDGTKTERPSLGKDVKVWDHHEQVCHSAQGLNLEIHVAIDTASQDESPGTNERSEHVSFACKPSDGKSGQLARGLGVALWRSKH